MTKNRTRDEDGAPNPTDVHVGQQLRLRRIQLQLSQEKLADGLGLTFQQIQKYERGLNRIGASRLLELGRVLDVPVGYFFDQLENQQAGGLAEDGAAYTPAPAPLTHSREAAELLALFGRIDDPRLRRQVLALVKTVVETGQAVETGKAEV